MTAALAQLEGSGDPNARALVELSRNRPAEVLGQPRPRDARGWRYRALAAWRTGDAGELTAAIEALHRAGEPNPELDAFAAIARAASGPLRCVAHDEPRAAAFDPALRVPIIEVNVGGEPARFILDTGAEITIVDRRAATRLGVRTPPGAAVTLDGNAGSTSVVLGLVPRLEMLGLTLEDVPAVVADLSALPPQLGVIGILGVQDLLARGVLRIDYAAGEVTRSTRGRNEGWPMVFVEGRAIVAVEGLLDGGPSGLFRIDTGGRRSVLTNDYVDAAVAGGARWEVTAPEMTEVRGVGAARRARRTLVRSTFRTTGGADGLALRETLVDTTAADGLIAYAGKLGADVFAGRVLELDYDFGRLRLSDSDREAAVSQSRPISHARVPLVAMTRSVGSSAGPTKVVSSPGTP